MSNLPWCEQLHLAMALHAAATWLPILPADQQEVDELEQAMAQLAEAGSPGNTEEGQGDLLDDFVLSATQVCFAGLPAGLVCGNCNC